MAKKKKIETLFSDGDGIIDDAEEAIILGVQDAEQSIFKEVIQIFNEVDISAGKLKNNAKAKQYLLGLDDRIKRALYNSKYKSAVDGLIGSYDKLTENNILIQQAVNKKNITAKDLLPIQQLEVNNTLDRLLGSGVSKDFISPVRQTLYRSVVLGISVEETRQALEDFIVSKPAKESTLSKYVSQVSRDSIMQFDGAIQQSIGVELDLPDYIYTGSIIRDSRAQCVHWATKGELNGAELEEEIQTAIEGGFLQGKKCSGMNPSCTLQTFSIYRGGYNCRHRAIVTLL